MSHTFPATIHTSLTKLKQQFYLVEKHSQATTYGKKWFQ